MCYNVHITEKGCGDIKVSIIDNSLINMGRSSTASEEIFKDYVISLFKCGVDYIEIDGRFADLTKTIDTSRHFIFNVQFPTDVSYINEKAFSYAVLPLNLLFIAPAIKNTRIIVELNTDNIPIESLIERLYDNYALRYASMLRITGSFTDNIDKLKNFIVEFRHKFAIPLDICPLDTNLDGLDAAFCAYMNRADALTLSFGESSCYTSLEKFLIYLHVYYGKIVSDEYVKGLCAAALDCSVLSCRFERGVKNLSEVVIAQSDRVMNIDFPQKSSTVRTKKGTKRDGSSVNISNELRTELLSVISDSKLDLVNDEEAKKFQKKIEKILS